MKVKELIEALQACDPEDTVEGFKMQYDETYKIEDVTKLSDYFGDDTPGVFIFIH